jgi:hypothetical protein
VTRNIANVIASERERERVSEKSTREKKVVEGRKCTIEKSGFVVLKKERKMKKNEKSRGKKGMNVEEKKRALNNFNFIRLTFLQA